MSLIFCENRLNIMLEDQTNFSNLIYFLQGFFLNFEGRIIWALPFTWWEVLFLNVSIDFELIKVKGINKK